MSKVYFIGLQRIRIGKSEFVAKTPFLETSNQTYGTRSKCRNDIVRARNNSKFDFTPKVEKSEPV